MTWNGQQGFQTPIEDESFLVDNMGVLGHMHTERGLTCKRLLPMFPFRCYPQRLWLIPPRSPPRRRDVLQRTYGSS